MNKLIIRDIRQNLRLFIGTIIAVAISVAIISACMTLVFSSQALNDFGLRFTEMDLVVKPDKTVTIEYNDDGKNKTDSKNMTGDPVFTQAQLTEVLEDVDGVLDYTFFAEPINMEYGKITGHNVSSMAFTAFEIVEGHSPKPGQVMVDVDFADQNLLELGDDLEIMLNDGMAVYSISGMVDSDTDHVYELQNYLFFEEAEASQLAHGCYAVAIKTRDVEALADDFKDDGYQVFYGEKINRAEHSQMVINDISMTVVFITMGSLCLMISLFVISGTIQFSIRNRFRMLALLRVLGFKKGQVKGLLRKQSFIISLIGGAFGTLLSLPVTGLIVLGYQEVGLLGRDFEVVHYFLMDGAIVAAVALLVLLVTGLTANKPLSVAPANAMKSEGEMNSKMTMGGLITGIILIAGGIAVLMFTPMTQGIGIGMGFCASSLFLGGAMMLTPVLMRFINFFLSLFTKRLYSGMGSVANANIKMKASKFAVASVSIAIMMSMGTTMMLNNFTYMDVMVEDQYEFAKDYAYVAYGLSPFQLEDDDVLGYKATELLYRDGEDVEDIETIAVISDLPNINVIDGDAELGLNEILISEKIHSFDVGDEMEVWLENGESVTLMVKGIMDSKGIKDEGINGVVRFEDVKGSFFSTKIGRVYMKAPIEGALENTKGLYEDSPGYDVQLGASLLLGVIGIVLSLIALFNTFAVIMSVRKKEFNGLKLIGAKKNQIFKMTLIETIIVTITGLIIGMLVLFGAVGTYSYANTGVYDWIVNGQVFWGTVTITGLLGLMAGIIPSVGTIVKLRRQFRNE